MPDPALHPDLHGNAPDHSPVVLLLIDVITDFDFPGGEQLLEQARPMAEKLAALIARARSSGVAVVYANDNFGRWRSDFRTLVAHCLGGANPGREIVALLQPREDDYFVLKPKHSGFYATSLDLLLRYLGAHTLILAGLAGNVCVQFTANDAFLRDYRLNVPRDCIASESAALNQAAVEQMSQLLNADTRPSTDLDLDALQRRECAAEAAG